MSVDRITILIRFFLSPLSTGFFYLRTVKSEDNYNTCSSFPECNRVTIFVLLFETKRRSAVRHNTRNCDIIMGGGAREREMRPFVCVVWRRAGAAIDDGCTLISDEKK